MSATPEEGAGPKAEVGKPLPERLNTIAVSHRESITVLAEFVNHMLSLQGGPQLRDPEEAARFLRLSPAILSTLLPEEITKHQKSIQEAVEQERERQRQIRAVFEQFPGLLMHMALIYRVALFDAFISDLQLCVLTERPDLLKNNDRTLTYTQIIEATSEDRLVEFLAESIVTGLGRRAIGEQLKKMGNNLQTGFKLQEQIERPLTELIARRNIFTHANGVVNSVYRSLVPDSPHPLGAKLDVPYEYWTQAHQLMRTVCDQLLLSVFARHCGGTTAPKV